MLNIKAPTPEMVAITNMMVVNTDISDTEDLQIKVGYIDGYSVYSITAFEHA